MLLFLQITKGNTIETNEKNLNMNVADSQFAVSYSRSTSDHTLMLVFVTG